MDDVASLMGSAGVDPRIKKRNGKYVVDGVGEFDSYQDAIDALDKQTGDKISGQGPTNQLWISARSSLPLMKARP
jgi:hypothetical protein